MLQTTVTVLMWFDLLSKPSPNKKTTLCSIPTFRFGIYKSICLGAIQLSIALKDVSQRISHPQFFYVDGILIMGGFAIRVAFTQDFKQNTNIYMQQNQLLLLVW